MQDVDNISCITHVFNSHTHTGQGGVIATGA